LFWKFWQELQVMSLGAARLLTSKTSMVESTHSQLNNLIKMMHSTKLIHPY